MKADWLIGPLEPLGGNRFRIALDLSWLGDASACLAIRHRLAEFIRDAVQPVYSDFFRNGNIWIEVLPVTCQHVKRW